MGVLSVADLVPANSGGSGSTPNAGAVGDFDGPVLGEERLGHQGVSKGFGPHVELDLLDGGVRCSDVQSGGESDSAAIPVGNDRLAIGVGEEQMRDMSFR